MEHDDPYTGRLLSRREALGWLGLAGAGMLVRSYRASAQDRPACIARPQQMEGPYFVDTGLNRSDIRSEPASGAVKPGVPLQLAFQVSRVDRGGCAPLRDAHVELWQCDALGVYSGVRDQDFDTTGQKYLRGYQVTDAAGAARFMTIYPGWYPGRTVHLHFTIRTGRSSGRREEFTSQLYFDDGLTDRVLANPPYSKRGPRTQKNAGDGLYRRGGSQLLLAVREQGKGLAATFDIGMQAGA